MTKTTKEAVIRLLSEARGIPEMAAGMVLDFDEIDALIALAAERDALAALHARDEQMQDAGWKAGMKEAAGIAEARARDFNTYASFGPSKTEFLLLEKGAKEVAADILARMEGK
jgi:hypothetical protein